MKRLFITLFALIVVGFSQVTREVTPLLGDTNQTTVGTITTGVWNAGAVTSSGAGTFTAGVSGTTGTFSAGVSGTTGTFTGAVKSTANAGTVEGNGVVAVEYGDGFNHVTILTLTATADRVSSIILRISLESFDDDLFFFVMFVFFFFLIFSYPPQHPPKTCQTHRPPHPLL